MKKAERSDANKTLFVPKLRVKLSKFTMAKAPASTKRGCRKKDASPRLVAMPEFPSVSSPREHSVPKNPCGAVPRGLRIPTVSLPNLPPLPKFPTVSLPSLTSLPRIPTVAIPPMPSLPTIPEIEAILATPFQFVASVWPTCLNPSNIFTRSSEGNAASSSSDGEATGSRACNSFSAQSLFNFSASSLRFPSAFKLYELALLKSFGSPDTKNDDQSDKDQVDCTNLAKKRRTEETADLNANELTSDQMTKMLSDFLSNCNCDAKAKLLHQLVEQKSKSEELDKCYLHCSSSEESLCKICMESPMDCVLLECGHIVSCLKCGSQLTQCPICREVVVRVVRTFRS